MAVRGRKGLYIRIAAHEFRLPFHGPALFTRSYRSARDGELKEARTRMGERRGMSRFAR